MRVLSIASVFSLLTFAAVVDIASARPAPGSKKEWIRKAGKAKRQLLNPDHLHGKRWTNNTGTPGDANYACSDLSPKAITAPKENPWNGLTDVEAATVTAWLFDQPELNLTTSDEAGEWDNSIILVELNHPNKSDVISYFDGNGPAPPRYAHVVLDFRATVDPYYQDILVGPLPLQNGTVGNATYQNGTSRWVALEYPYTKKDQGRVRNLDADDDTLYSAWIYKVGASVADITMDLWGGMATGSDNDTLDIWGIDPLWQDDGRIVRWDTFWNLPVDDFDAETLLPLGLYFKSDVTGRDPSQWQLQGWYYNAIFYPTTAAFRNAYYAGQVQKLAPNMEGDWARTDQQGPILPLDTAYPPTTIAPAGSRYYVDAERKFVQWQDFSFYMGFTRDLGLALYDIRYKGQRIIYELGLQEALAHYASSDPVQSGTSYLDSFYGFGPYTFELVKGYDCPAYATYLNTSFYVDETTHTHIDSLCLFEFTADYPMQRHSTGKYVSTTKNTYFTVRYVATVGNYDYLFSYKFQQDGTVGVEVRASGYIQSTYYAANEDYGWQIHDALSGSMHDHVLNFKADFDILGTANTMQLMTQYPVTEAYPWSNGKTRNTMKLKRHYIESESESRLFWDQNSATQFIVVNKDQPNAYGVPRGYRILPDTGTIHLTVQNSSNLENAANWSPYDIQVTRQHDTEPRAAHPYNSQDVFDPPINFDDFFNGESLDQEDIVVWANLGMHHVPHTGDLPNTVFTTAHSGIQFMPLNYLLGDPSRQSVNQVRIDYGGGNGSRVPSTVDTFGQIDDSCTVNFEPIEPDLSEYVGDVVIRKFPYDPNDPYFETDSIV